MQTTAEEKLLSNVNEKAAVAELVEDAPGSYIGCPVPRIESASALMAIYDSQFALWTEEEDITLTLVRDLFAVV